jgi:hypothetical protein
MASQWAKVLTSLAYCGALFKDKVTLLREQGLLIKQLTMSVRVLQYFQ